MHPLRWGPHSGMTSCVRIHERLPRRHARASASPAALTLHFFGDVLFWGGLRGFEAASPFWLLFHAAFRVSQLHLCLHYLGLRFR